MRWNAFGWNKYIEIKEIPSAWKTLRMSWMGLPPIQPLGAVQYDDPAFTDYYRQQLVPLCEPFEEKRLTALQTMCRRARIGVPLILAVLVAAGFGFIPSLQIEDGPVALFWVTAALIVALWAWIGWPGVVYRSGIKQEIFPKIFRYFGPDFRYHADHSPLKMASLSPSLIIPSHDNEASEDYVSGTYKGVTLELCETHLSEMRGSGKNRRRVTTFKGLVVRLSMNKPFRGRTILKRDYGILGNWAQRAGGLERVRLEDPTFEKQFEVFSDDQIEARYLLSPSMMERMQQLTQLSQGKSLQASFFEHSLLLMIESSKAYFEGSDVFEPATFERETRVILEEMATLFAMIELLKLHETTHL